MANTTGFKARVEYEVTDGTQTTYTFPFSYLRKKFVMVSILHSDATVTALEYGVDYTVNDLSVSLTTPAQVGEHIIIYRQTSTDKIVTWNDGSILLAQDMNTEDAQMLHLQEEQQDYIMAHAITTRVTSDKEVLWDARNHRITNVSDPQNPQDAVTKHYMEAVQGGFVAANTILVQEATKQASAAKTSETNAHNSETAANESEDMSKKWAMSPVSPDGVVDTNSPTGYTQSAKIWAALSKEYAGLSKFKLPIGYYKSVAEMKASETAIVGRPCVTLGYYESNDGGGAVYIIRQKKESDVDDGGSVLVLDNGNVAELLIDDVLNIKQFGAVGNDSNDDTTAIETAMAICANKKSVLFIPSGMYKISHEIKISQCIHISGVGADEREKGSYIHIVANDENAIGIYTPYVKITDLGICGNGAGNGSGIVIGAQGATAQNTQLHNIIVSNMGGDGITLRSGNNVTLKGIKTLYNQKTGFAIRPLSDANYSGENVEIINSYGNGEYGAKIGGEGSTFYIVAQSNSNSNILIDSYTTGCIINGYTEYSKNGYELEDIANSADCLITGTYRSNTGKQYYKKTDQRNLIFMSDGEMKANSIPWLLNTLLGTSVSSLGDKTIQSALTHLMKTESRLFSNTTVLPTADYGWGNVDSGVYLYNGWKGVTMTDGPALTNCTGICLKYINASIGSFSVIITDTGKIAVSSGGEWKIYSLNAST
ncbi:MAG: phage tail fiber protein [Megasphaera sp.]|uniref:phage tail fiber domain-containing protein n=1 Tax=Megasphaera sp. TaxID=2023260 RepID=UPI003EFFEE35